MKPEIESTSFQKRAPIRVITRNKLVVEVGIYRTENIIPQMVWRKWVDSLLVVFVPFGSKLVLVWSKFVGMSLGVVVRKDVGHFVGNIVGQFVGNFVGRFVGSVVGKDVVVNVGHMLV